MARPRKDAATKKAEAEAKVSNGLLDAVKFCAPGYKDGGEAYASHARIEAGWISTYDGIVQFGHKIETDLTALPHYGLLLKALRTTDNAGVQVTQLDAKRLQIKGKGFRTIIPCLDTPDLVTRQPPDPPVSVLDSRMREAFEALRQIVSKRGETIMQSAILVGNGFAVACDNAMLGMFWHGIGFPEVAVPADFVEAVLKVTKSLVSFGYTPDQSLTFYFEDGSFIRTQLYAEKYPDYNKALPTNWDGLDQLPDTFFTALERIEPFLPKDQHHVHLWDNAISTDRTLETGTVVDCPGLADAPSAFDPDRLLKLKGLATHMDYRHPEKARFVGENFRGVLMAFLMKHEAPEAGKPPIDTGYDPETFAHEEANGLDVPEDAPMYGHTPTFAPPTPAGPVEYDESENDGFAVPKL